MLWVAGATFSSVVVFGDDRSLLPTNNLSKKKKFTPIPQTEIGGGRTVAIYYKFRSIDKLLSSSHRYLPLEIPELYHTISVQSHRGSPYSLQSDRTISFRFHILVTIGLYNLCTISHNSWTYLMQSICNQSGRLLHYVVGRSIGDCTIRL